MDEELVETFAQQVVHQSLVNNQIVTVFLEVVKLLKDRNTSKALDELQELLDVVRNQVEIIPQNSPLRDMRMPGKKERAEDE